MSKKYNYDDIVILKHSINAKPRVGQKCWIVGVFDKRPHGGYMDHFPDGTVYTVEFEDGCSIEAHEDDLEILESD